MVQKKAWEFDEINPPRFYLSQNYPNPFKERTTIKYCVGYKTRVLLTIYNSDRKTLYTLIDEIKEAGTYKIEIDLAVDNYLLTGRIFYYRLIADNYTDEKKMKVII